MSFRVPLFYIIFPTVLSVISIPFYVLTLPCIGRAPVVDSCEDICYKRSKACCETRVHRDFAIWVTCLPFNRNTVIVFSLFVEERYTIAALWINRILWVPIVHVWWAIDEILFYSYWKMDDQNDPMILIQVKSHSKAS